MYKIRRSWIKYKCNFFGIRVFLALLKKSKISLLKNQLCALFSTRNRVFVRFRGTILVKFLGTDKKNYLCKTKTFIVLLRI